MLNVNVIELLKVIWNTIFPNGLSREVILYLSSAVLQAYAALIAIPFAIAVIHLQSKYGYISTQILFKRLNLVLKVFTIIAIVSVLSMILSLNDKYLPYILFAEVITALAPLKYLIKHVRDVFSLKPTDILHDLGYPERPAELLKQGKVFEAWNVISQGFELARACSLDPVLHSQANVVIWEIAGALHRIDWNSDVREEKHTGSLDLSGILFNVVWNMPTHIVEPVVRSQFKPNPIQIEILVREIANGFMEKPTGTFDNFLEHVYKLVTAYYEVDTDRAWEIFHSILLVSTNYLKSCEEEKAKTIIERILPIEVCYGLQICDYAYKHVEGLPQVTDFGEREIKIYGWFLRILDILKDYPSVLFHILCLEKLEDILEKFARKNIPPLQILLILALCNQEKAKLPEYMDKIAESVLEGLTNKVLKILKENKWRPSFDGNSLKIFYEDEEFASMEIDEKQSKLVEEYLYSLNIVL